MVKLLQLPPVIEIHFIFQFQAILAEEAQEVGKVAIARVHL